MFTNRSELICFLFCTKFAVRIICTRRCAVEQLDATWAGGVFTSERHLAVVGVFQVSVFAVPRFLHHVRFPPFVLNFNSLTLLE